MCDKESESAYLHITELLKRCARNKQEFDHIITTNERLEVELDNIRREIAARTTNYRSASGENCATCEKLKAEMSESNNVHKEITKTFFITVSKIYDEERNVKAGLDPQIQDLDQKIYNNKRCWRAYSTLMETLTSLKYRKSLCELEMKKKAMVTQLELASLKSKRKRCEFSVEHNKRLVDNKNKEFRLNCEIAKIEAHSILLEQTYSNNIEQMLIESKILLTDWQVNNKHYGTKLLKSNASDVTRIKNEYKHKLDALKTDIRRLSEDNKAKIRNVDNEYKADTADLVNKATNSIACLERQIGIHIAEEARINNEYTVVCSADQKDLESLEAEIEATKLKIVRARKIAAASSH